MPFPLTMRGVVSAEIPDAGDETPEALAGRLAAELRGWRARDVECSGTEVVFSCSVLRSYQFVSPILWITRGSLGVVHREDGLAVDYRVALTDQAIVAAVVAVAVCAGALVSRSIDLAVAALMACVLVLGHVIDAWLLTRARFPRFLRTVMRNGMPSSQQAALLRRDRHQRLVAYSGLFGLLAAVYTSLLMGAGPGPLEWFESLLMIAYCALALFWLRALTVARHGLVESVARLPGGLAFAFWAAVGFAMPLIAALALIVQAGHSRLLALMPLAWAAAGVATLGLLVAGEWRRRALRAG